MNGLFGLRPRLLASVDAVDQRSISLANRPGAGCRDRCVLAPGVVGIDRGIQGVQGGGQRGLSRRKLALQRGDSGREFRLPYRDGVARGLCPGRVAVKQDGVAAIGAAGLDDTLTWLARFLRPTDCWRAAPSGSSVDWLMNSLGVR